MKTLPELAQDLAEGRTTSRALVEECLENIADGAEGERAFRRVDHAKVRAWADAVDALREAGVEPTPFAGIPVSVKDLYDVRGEVTAAGSAILQDAPPASADAPCIARLRAAGFVFIGRTNMVEFAYGGVGLNPHFGTPRSPWDRETGRAPGGSSSGAAVSVTDGMAAVALGTDTAGSCRIPAALCGVVGYKPTQKRVPLDNVYPLSQTLDSAGPLGRSVDCCAVVDAFFAGAGAAPEPVQRDPRQLRFGALQTMVMDGLDDIVANAYGRALRQLSDAGATVEEVDFPELDDLSELYGRGGFAAAEAYAWHKDMLASVGDRYDPRVGGRIKLGATIDSAGYVELLNERKRIRTACDKLSRPYDAIIAPTVPIEPPTIAECDNDENYGPINLKLLRNTRISNFVDGCSISLPCHREGDAPVGLMLMAGHGEDDALFATARTVERLLARR